MKKPTETETLIQAGNGTKGKKVKVFSYVAVICRKNGSEVMAIRTDYHMNKADAAAEVRKIYPQWNVKLVNRLYDIDFNENCPDQV